MTDNSIDPKLHKYKDNLLSAKEISRPKKSEGQWALGDSEALNPVEEAKQEDNPLFVRQRIEEIYAIEGFNSIPKDDLRIRFRWLGLYTQRKKGYDGTFTRDENIDLLEDEHFMLRIRCDGGALTSDQLHTIGIVSSRYARNTADISDRQNIQLHWIRIEDMPAIWRELESVNLFTTEACGDCPRVILSSPLAGLSISEVLDPTVAIKEIVRRYIGDPQYSNLPRKFKSSISWEQDVPFKTNDIAFIGVIHPDHGPGFDLWVGGGLSTNPMLAQRVGVWVPLKEIPHVWEAVVRIYRDYGYRRLRSKARIKFLIKDWGIERFREILESSDYLGQKLIDGPAPREVKYTIDHTGVTQLKDGTFAIGISPIAGRVTGEKLQQVAALAQSAGATRCAFTPYQTLVIIGVPESEVTRLTVELNDIDLPSTPSRWRQNLIACTGIEFCKLSFTETRSMAQILVPELEKRFADIDSQIGQSIGIHINGCPNSCARMQIADIGFKGQLVDDDHGGQTEGFQVHLGGSLGQNSNFGRKLRQHKVLANNLDDYIERVVRNYVNTRESAEDFAQWAQRVDEELLR